MDKESESSLDLQEDKSSYEIKEDNNIETKDLTSVQESKHDNKQKDNIKHEDDTISKFSRSRSSITEFDDEDMDEDLLNEEMELYLIRALSMKYREEKKHKCDKCGKAFYYKRKLNSHIETHKLQNASTVPIEAYIISKLVNTLSTNKPEELKENSDVVPNLSMTSNDNNRHSIAIDKLSEIEDKCKKDNLHDIANDIKMVKEHLLLLDNKSILTNTNL